MSGNHWTKGYLFWVFPKKERLLKGEHPESPRPRISRQALTVSPGVALCRAHSVLVPGSSALAPALSSSAVALPRYRPAGRYWTEKAEWRQSWAWRPGFWAQGPRFPLKPPSHQAPANTSGQLVEHVYHREEIDHWADLLQKVTGHAPCQVAQSPAGIEWEDAL